MGHAPIFMFMMVRMLQSTMESNTQPVVCVPWNDMVMVKRVLDAGAQSLHPERPFEANAADVIAWSERFLSDCRGASPVTRA